MEHGTNIRVTHFNPRSHKGSDETKKYSRRDYPDFNPRSHKGSDPTDVIGENTLPISTHAPTKGATTRNRV